MKINKQTISRKKLIKVKKSWLIVPLISILMNNTALVLAHASDNGTRYVQDNESFLKALKNKNVHSIYLEHDIKLNDQSLINDVPRRNLSINLSNHHLNLGSSEWEFINDFWDIPVLIKIQFIDGYLDVDKVEQINKNYNDRNNQVNFELSQIKPTSLESNDEVNDNSSSNKLNSNINGLGSSSANQNLNHDSEGVSSNYSSAVINASASQMNNIYKSTNNSELDGSNLNTGNQNNESKSSQTNNGLKPSSAIYELEYDQSNSQSTSTTIVYESSFNQFNNESKPSSDVFESEYSQTNNGSNPSSDVFESEYSQTNNGSKLSSDVFESEYSQTNNGSKLSSAIYELEYGQTKPESKPSNAIYESESNKFNNESIANDNFIESSSQSHSIDVTSNPYVINGSNANIISNSNSLSSPSSSANSAIFNSEEDNYKTPSANHSLNSVVGSPSNYIANILSSSESSKDFSMTVSNYQPNTKSLSSDVKQFDYLNLIPKIKENLSSNRYSSDDFYRSISKVLQSLITSKNDLNNRVQSLESNHSISQSSNVLNDFSGLFLVTPHRVKVKQKCYIYSSATFDVNKRMRLATNEELADQVIKEHSYSKYGRLRYKVKDGFITANPKFVQKLS